MLKKLFFLVFPFFVWIFIYRDFIQGRLFIGGDNIQYFHWVSYYIENIIDGVFPLWNPFHSWGSVDNFDMRFMGEFNPLWIFAAVLTALGVNLYVVFVVLILVYFWLACFGVYIVALRLTKEHSYATLAYVLMIFSSLGVMVLWQFVFLIVFVPALWFFIYLIDFINARDAKHRRMCLIGLTFTLIIIASSYIPFYFLILFCCFCLAGAFCYPGQYKVFFNNVLCLVKESPIILVLSFVTTALALLPIILWKIESSSGEYVLFINRAVNAVSDAAAVSLEAINLSGLATEGSWPELFADFESGVNHMIFIPVLVFVLFVCSLATRFRRIQLFIFLIGLLLVIIGLADVTPVHRFLYEHIFFMKYFRNYFFFLPFISALLILFLVCSLKEFIALIGQIRMRLVAIGLIVLLHLGMVVFLITIDNVPVVSFITIAASFVWCLVGVLFQRRLRPDVFIFGFICLAILQPFFCLSYYSKLCSRSPISHERRSMEFVYTRPLKGSGFNEEHGFHQRIKLRKDESGFVDSGYFGTQYAYDFLSRMDPNLIKDYVKYKFVIYDNPANGDLNAAYTPVAGPSHEFAITHFNVNSIDMQTNFMSRKFIVYNDSFHSGWRGSIDGKPLAIIKANQAFKGFWTEAGVHSIKLRFYSPLREKLFLILVIISIGWLMALAGSYFIYVKSPKI